MDDTREHTMRELKSLRARLEAMRKETGMAWEILEQDYALSWMLIGIAAVPRLKSTLIFKGGTALKKCFFGSYRFSQDLDFSVRGDGEHLLGDELFELLQNACTYASEQLKKQNTFLQFRCQRYKERLPHPENQEAFTVYVQFPWHSNQLTTRIMVEVTTRERVLLEPLSRKIIHRYEEINEDITIQTYPLEEIVAEKVRAILQYAKKLHERGWGRSRARDYYDLWRIFNEYTSQLNVKILPELIDKKCEVKGVAFGSLDDLFSPTLMVDLDKAWQQWLEPIVPNLPSKEQIVTELREMLSKTLDLSITGNRSKHSLHL